MSILLKNTEGWLLDQCSFLSNSFQCCLEVGENDQKQYLKCSFKRHYFDIFKPHITLKPDPTDTSVTDSSAQTAVGCKDSEADSILPTEEKRQTTLTTDRKKRKRKHKELNQGEIDSQFYHDKVRRVILEGTPIFVEEGFSCGYLSTAEKDKLSLPISPDDGRLADLCDMAKQLPLVDDSEQKPVQVIEDNDKHQVEQLDLFTRVTCNPLNCARVVTLMGKQYLLPPHCSFLLSDITRMQPLVNYGKKFDAIVLDPPWENKSVKRSRRYSFLPSSQLRRLPVPLLSAPGCVVATWVTNRQKHLRFVKEDLYPHWGVEVLAEWLWVKITRSGEFVFPLDSPHKKPYEVLVLGRYRGSKDHSVSDWTKSEPALPDKRLLVSIPSLLHSQKPSLSEVLKEYLGPGTERLELFARNLQPGWTSWGNEVIKFQHVHFFDVEPASSPTGASSSPRSPLHPGDGPGNG
ncbi:N(6)-adenine-specific methyltransferase METTL4 [Megalops cyprinoides]|uniref:N(6)-adenine-specific methyltransferase METTL4 n=1 Tax=Megalops cyprinoides TaxID=118141 RepID=UPI00186455A1|nr:N(6)-adenine-specific methyltransferase METTL4 [Megalops cyprinoides]